ncbi:Peptidyl-prolyl cis-trans isomerase CWC27 like protein [Eufriesea mexicana]|uniref:Peptidyl-prolyl cis-trans isomerase CWC27 like protein n=1 Tax=Eufriesea mexicana TaxID=516756 RepID=A0A310SM15_9HYME|nr:Peptidyl-prolyl cis-trans isomerase CWC27 like protein [Eufriesea mexicana]
MRVIEEMENEQVVIVMKGKVKLNIKCKCCIKAKMCRNIYRNMETVKAAGIMWHMELIGPIKSTLKEDESYCWKGDNDSQYFFIHSSTPDLQNKHTMFGRVTGEYIYKLSPDSIVLCNQKFGYRDFSLLSFGGEAKEDEEESVILNKKFTGKGKSAHDHLTDPKLSSQPAVEPSGLANKKRKKGCSRDWEGDDEVQTQGELEVVKKHKEVMKERIKNALRDTEKEPKKVQNYGIDDVEDDKDIKENE